MHLKIRYGFSRESYYNNLCDGQKERKLTILQKKYKNKTNDFAKNKQNKIDDFAKMK